LIEYLRLRTQQWDGVLLQMGRTIPSFRIEFEILKKEWKTFRNALDKSERKEFDDMFDLLDSTC
jgi:hypothetical protein